MTLHLVALPHTRVSPSFSTCAYTQKIVKFCRMMDGHMPVVLYAPEHVDVPCVEHVTTVMAEEQLEWFGEWDSAASPNVDWDTTKPWWTLSNARAASGIAERHEHGDLVLLIAGMSQKPILDVLGSAVLPIEWGVGYEGVIGEPFRYYESYAWMHHVMGLRAERDGRWFDGVVPNFFDLNELPFGDGGDYAVWMARWIPRKGPDAAIEMCREAGIELIMAGPGREPGEIEPGIRHIGPVDVAARSELLGGARALLMPTMYTEPFGGVAVEAMLCGTPAITTDWGAFPETVTQGVTGYRVHTRGEGVDALKLAGNLDRARVREHAASRYSLDAVRPQFQAQFERLGTLWEKGWYSKKPLAETLSR